MFTGLRHLFSGEMGLNGIIIGLLMILLGVGIILAMRFFYRKKQ